MIIFHIKCYYLIVTLFVGQHVAYIPFLNRLGYSTHPSSTLLKQLPKHTTNIQISPATSITPTQLQDSPYSCITIHTTLPTLLIDPRTHTTAPSAPPFPTQLLRPTQFPHSAPPHHNSRHSLRSTLLHIQLYPLITHLQ